MTQLAYSTSLGRMYHSDIKDFVNSRAGKRLYGKVQLVFTSPPFPLNRKKKYGNEQGDEYLTWIAEIAPLLCKLLRPDGSIVMELGNSWEPQKPVMSTLALEALLTFKRTANLNLCQQFVAYNPARLPAPAQWVNIERIRVKDAFTHLWWMSPSERPLANNRWVLKEYSPAMKQLHRTGKYNAGKRPSEYVINATSFLTDNGGAIPPNVLIVPNTSTNDEYHKYCEANNLVPHPARMPEPIPEFFIKFLTQENDLVLDPFGGANTTGMVAERLKRRWVAVEKSADYITGSEARFERVSKNDHESVTVA